MTIARPVMIGLLLLARLRPASADQGLVIPDLTLASTSGQSYAMGKTVTNSRFTVLVFFSASCPCVAAHDERLSQLARDYDPKDVQFFLVDSEVGDALARGRDEVQKRGYPFPILADPGGRLAHALDVKFATTTLVLDSAGAVQYRGGIDSDKRRPNPSGRFYLREALSALLSGKRPDLTETKSLGCYLRIS
jgi:peroxiredoxin